MAVLTVRVELDLPENVWRALCLVAERFGESIDDCAAGILALGLKRLADEYLDPHVSDLLYMGC